MSGLPWFRMYSEAVDNDKLRLLAFEDRWHFVAILCCKSQGILDDHPQTLDRRMAVKLGVQLRELDEVRRRLMEVDLITDDWQPVGWKERQFRSDQDPTAAERKRRQRQRQRHQNQEDINSHESCHALVTRESRGTVTDVTRTDTDTDTEEEEKKKSIKKKKSSVPDEFPITEQMQEYAKAKGIKGDLIEITEDFLIHHRKHGNQFSDWYAAWQTWIRKHLEFQKENSKEKEKEKQPWFMRGI